jgi:hypothetical protein
MRGYFDGVELRDHGRSDGELRFVEEPALFGGTRLVAYAQSAWRSGD